MNEVRASEIVESREVPYQRIKPQTNLTFEKAREFWDKRFSENQTVDETYEDKDTETEPDKDIESCPKVVFEEGHHKYYDDNGKLYRIDSELIPGCEYTIKGYDYKTDEHGRITEASGKLRIKEHTGHKSIKDPLKDIGKGDENEETDDKGHLIGDQFGGINGLENAIAQDYRVNRNDYKILEDKLAARVKNGDDVRVQIEPVYEGNSHRPEAISYTYSINGEISVQIFPNGKE